MCKKHIKLFFGVYRSKSDRAFFGIVLLIGSEAVTDEITELFGHSCGDILDFFPAENKGEIIAKLVPEGYTLIGR